MTSSVSAVSTRSDATLVHEDDTETVVDETETVVVEAERGRAISVAESADDGRQMSRQSTLTAGNGGDGRKTESVGGGGGEGEREEEEEEEEEEEAEEVIPASHPVNGLVEGKRECEGENVKDGGREEEGEREGKGELSARHMSVVFRQELLNTVHLKIHSRIGLEIAKLSDTKCDIVQLVGRCLPHIVPNVILAKREVSVPHNLSMVVVCSTYYSVCIYMYMYIHVFETRTI